MCSYVNTTIIKTQTILSTKSFFVMAFVVKLSLTSQPHNTHTHTHNLLFRNRHQLFTKNRFRRTMKDGKQKDNKGECNPWHFQMILFKTSSAIIALLDSKSHKPTQGKGHVLSLPPQSSVIPLQVTRIGRPLPEYSQWQMAELHQERPRRETQEGPPQVIVLLQQ